MTKKFFTAKTVGYPPYGVMYPGGGGSEPSKCGRCRDTLVYQWLKDQVCATGSGGIDRPTAPCESVMCQIACYWVRHPVGGEGGTTPNCEYEFEFTGAAIIVCQDAMFPVGWDYGCGAGDPAGPRSAVAIFYSQLFRPSEILCTSDSMLEYSGGYKPCDSDPSWNNFDAEHPRRTPEDAFKAILDDLHAAKLADSSPWTEDAPFNAYRFPLEDIVCNCEKDPELDLCVDLATLFKWELILPGVNGGLCEYGYRYKESYLAANHTGASVCSGDNFKVIKVPTSAGDTLQVQVLHDETVAFPACSGDVTCCGDTPKLPPELSDVVAECPQVVLAWATRFNWACIRGAWVLLDKQIVYDSASLGLAVQFNSQTYSGAITCGSETYYAARAGMSVGDHDGYVAVTTFSEVHTGTYTDECDADVLPDSKVYLTCGYMWCGYTEQVVILLDEQVAVWTCGEGFSGPSCGACVGEPHDEGPKTIKPIYGSSGYHNTKVVVTTKTVFEMGLGTEHGGPNVPGVTWVNWTQKVLVMLCADVKTCETRPCGVVGGATYEYPELQVPLGYCITYKPAFVSKFGDFGAYCKCE